MAAIKAELATSGFSRVRVDFIELILSVAKAIEENPGTDIRSHDQIYDPIRQLVRMIPAPV
jgi:hypothetical protein